MQTGSNRPVYLGIKAECTVAEPWRTASRARAPIPDTTITSTDVTDHTDYPVLTPIMRKSGINLEKSTSPG